MAYLEEIEEDLWSYYSSLLYEGNHTLTNVEDIARTLLYHFCPSIKAEERDILQNIDDEVALKMASLPAPSPALINKDEPI